MFDLGDLQDLTRRVGTHDGAGLDEAALVDHVAALEQLKSASAASQAQLTARLAAQRSAREAAQGVSPDQRCRGLAAEIALARRESPVSGARSLGLAKALVREMPHTLAALAKGEISEWRATLMVRETAVLRREDRAQVDSELASEIGQMGDRQLVGAARSIGYRLDPGSPLRRIKGANADRRISLRPAPDTMTYLTGFLPVAQGVACLAALQRHADSLRGDGDPRTRGQLMADRLVALVTGQDVAQGTPVEIQLVITDSSLLDGDHHPATLRDYGPIPAATGRDLVRTASRAWVRRLYTSPAEGTLVAMDSRRRLFSGQLREFLIARDQICRNLWCGAAIRHIDHLKRVIDGGATDSENGQGLCEACNYAKEAPGWRVTREPGHRHRIKVTTPTGHEYESTAPRLTG